MVVRGVCGCEVGDISLNKFINLNVWRTPTHLFNSLDPLTRPNNLTTNTGRVNLTPDLSSMLVASYISWHCKPSLSLLFGPIKSLETKLH